MLKLKKYAAIDIGSNAIRLLIETVIERDEEAAKYKKTSLVRVPIRLGTDVFVNKNISDHNYSRMVDTLNAYHLLMKTHDVSKYRACATSAMREAENGLEVANKLFKETGIEIEIIDGVEEAEIIASTDIKDYLKADKTFLYVDVGGGSTEFTVIDRGETIASRSFKLGTVRLINNLVEDNVWLNVKDWIKSNTKDYHKISLLGTGGNINSVYKSSLIPYGKPLKLSYLKSYYKKIKSITYEDRIVNYLLNPDRADVIVPALKIYISSMNWSDAKKVYVPKIGLSDGIIRYLHNQSKKEKVN
jgi:exopolyphosphatase/guanosine-5'-triphosphate,3'-diphosphate pyrophosphatase